MGEFGDRYWGYKVSEVIEFATSSDVIFEFDGFKWMAIMEDLFIPRINSNSLPFWVQSQINT